MHIIRGAAPRRYRGQLAIAGRPCDSRSLERKFLTHLHLGFWIDKACKDRFVRGPHRGYSSHCRVLEVQPHALASQASRPFILERSITFVATLYISQILV
jgi:hypothetical protein